MRKLLLGVFFLFAVIYKAQNTDSLLTVVKQHPSDTSGYNALIELAFYYEGEDIYKAYHYALRAHKVATALDHKMYIAEALSEIGIVCVDIPKYDSSILCLQKSIEGFKTLGLFHDAAVSSVNLGITYRQKGNLLSAITCFYDGLKFAEKKKDIAFTGRIQMLLGNAYRQKGDLKMAEKRYFEALRIMSSVGDQAEMSFIYNNIGLLYSDRDEHAKALEYYFKSLKIRDSLKLKRQTAYTLEYIACEYADIDELKKSMVYHFKSLEMHKESGDDKGIATVLINLATVDTRRKDHKKAIVRLTDAMKLAQQIKHGDMLKEIYMALSQNYEASKQFQKGLEFHKLFLSLKDSLFNESESEQLIEMNTRYETEKKETQNKLLTVENNLSQKTIKQQKITTYFIISGLVLVLLFSFFIFRSLQENKKQKLLVEEKNEIIEEKQKEIIDSINYAKRIQYTLLAHDEFLVQHIPNHFVYFNPKDIVSGDFYWAAEVGKKFYLAVCDSTGHGVPGAFMSLLNIGFLSEAIKEKNILEPHNVLSYVRERLIETVSRDGQRDGFDGILLCIDTQSRKISYAAANNAPILIADGMLQELVADRMPVGKGERGNDFTLFETELKKGDTLYLYTDGYADQFGGIKGKKFMYKKLNQFLLDNSGKELKEQKQLLQDRFNEWKGSLEQVDDVCIIGIKL